MSAPDRPPTREEKLACIKRELGFRRRVYEHRIQQGKMKPEAADREIWLMEAVQRDYEGSTEGMLI